MDELGVDFWKLPSGEITNLPYLEAIANTNKPIVMSTGMASIEEVEQAINVVTSNGPKELTIAPLWSLHKRDVLNSLHKKLKDEQLYQGKYFRKE